MGWIRQMLGLEHDANGGVAKHQADPLAGFSDDEVSRAALDIVYGEAPLTDDSFWGGTVAKCDAAIARCEALRQKYANHQPPRLRRAIMDWIRFYEDRAKKDRRDCETGEHKKRMQDYDRECRERQRRTAEIHDALKTTK